MAAFTVVYDACVLYPAVVRDLLVEVAITDLVQAKWTARIHTEWTNALIRDRYDLDRLRLEGVARLMDRAAENSLVSGFEPLETALCSLPDPHDRHVLVAAIRCDADVIVTFNVRDFPDVVLKPYGRAVHPDPFIENLIYAKPAVMCAAIRTVRRRLVNPARSAEEMLANYERLGLVMTVKMLRTLRDAL